MTRAIPVKAETTASVRCNVGFQPACALGIVEPALQNAVSNDVDRPVNPSFRMAFALWTSQS